MSTEHIPGTVVSTCDICGRKISWRNVADGSLSEEEIKAKKERDTWGEVSAGRLSGPKMNYDSCDACLVYLVNVIEQFSDQARARTVNVRQAGRDV